MQKFPGKNSGTFEGKKFHLKSHLRQSCTKLFNYVQHSFSVLKNNDLTSYYVHVCTFMQISIIKNSLKLQPASARGIGIRVIHKWNQIPRKRPVIVQRYVSNRPHSSFCGLQVDKPLQDVGRTQKEFVNLRNQFFDRSSNSPSGLSAYKQSKLVGPLLLYSNNTEDAQSFHEFIGQAQ